MQLALALAADVLGEKDALACFVGLADSLVAGLAHDGWCLTRERVLEECRKLLKGTER